jgi:hypothetical protein
LTRNERDRENEIEGREESREREDEAVKRLQSANSPDGYVADTKCASL